jgi:hypothetical protein
MREVIVEHVGGTTRTIQIGVLKKRKSIHVTVFIGILCSPRILHISGSDSEKPRRKTKCWKTTKKGDSHAKRGWQRHTDRKPSRRRARHGHHRPWISPSARILNELGRCIYPCVDRMDYLEYTMERR